MARRGVLLPTAVAGAALVAVLRSAAPAFVAPMVPGAPAAGHVSSELVVRSPAVAMQARGGGPDIEGWIAEVQSGGGGQPEGAMKEYIMKWFWPAKDPFTGMGGAAPGKKDHKKVFQILQDAVKLGPAFDRGSSSAGFASVNGETSGVDGSPYTWLCGSMTPGGMFLFVTREFPGGKGVRPLLACKIGEEEQLWSKVNWNVVNKRLDITAGANLEPVEGDKQR